MVLMVPLGEDSEPRESVKVHVQCKTGYACRTL